MAIDSYLRPTASLDVLSARSRDDGYQILFLASCIPAVAPAAAASVGQRRISASRRRRRRRLQRRLFSSESSKFAGRGGLPFAGWPWDQWTPFRKSHYHALPGLPRVVLGLGPGRRDISSILRGRGEKRKIPVQCDSNPGLGGWSLPSHRCSNAPLTHTHTHSFTWL